MMTRLELKLTQTHVALTGPTKQQVLQLMMTSIKAFITSEFSCAPVVWMFHSCKQNRHINRIHERAMRVVYKDYNSSFDELLEKDNSYKIHDRNLQKLVTEI